MIDALAGLFNRQRERWISLRSALPYALVLAAAAFLLLLAEKEKDASFEEALRNYRRDASLQSRRAAAQVEEKFRLIYQGIRTLARLPGVRSIDRYAKNFDENARASAQEIYNNLAESVAVSEVYILPVDFDPDAVDPNTGKFQEPITTLDALIVGRTAETSGFHPHDRLVGRRSPVDEIEIHEYRLMKEQLAVLKARFPNEAKIDRLSYPAIAGREVITCDNTRYSPSKPDDRDRMGLVYSVPFYDAGGALRGMVSVVILTSAIKDLLPSDSFVLHNPRYDYVAARKKRPAAKIVYNPRTQRDTEPKLLYSEILDLDITDLTGGWTLWAGLQDQRYWSSAGAVSVSAKSTTQEIVIVVSAIILCIVIYFATEKYKAAQTRRLELEACIAERTSDLAEATKLANSANQAKSRFLSVMSHEMRTPMTAIIGMADLLSHSKLGLQESRYARVIHNSAAALLNIVNDILDLSKIEAGKIELHPDRFSIDQIISDVVGTFAEQSQNKDIKLTSEVDANMPPAVCVDGVRLRQVLLNLVCNAVKFTEKGEIRVSAKPGKASSDTQIQMLFSVTDTGVGIAPDVGDSIFQPFGQSHECASSYRTGTGLGLSISRTLVEMMGGTIRYESSPGNGTTFYFDIIAEPIASQADGAVSADKAAASDVTGATTGFRGASVLLAEDNPVTQEVIREYLQRLGIDVCVAENGRKAVALAMQRQFDAILMDCQMPDMDGFEATRLIRTQAAEAGRKPAPIVALTANAFVEDRARCLKAGMTDYLSKPFTAASLHQTLSKHLKLADSRSGS